VNLVQTVAKRAKSLSATCMEESQRCLRTNPPSTCKENEVVSFVGPMVCGSIHLFHVPRLSPIILNMDL
jgi:ABC-type uncharacterized transport system YnjBCD ATPase subunit